jgi:hypothetical protein
VDKKSKAIGCRKQGSKEDKKGGEDMRTKEQAHAIEQRYNELHLDKWRMRGETLGFAKCILVKTKGMQMLACATGRKGGAVRVIVLCSDACVRGHQELILTLRSEDRSASMPPKRRSAASF